MGARILHVTNGLVPGGAENHLAVLLPGLKRQGYEVEIAYPPRLHSHSTCDRTHTWRITL